MQRRKAETTRYGDWKMMRSKKRARVKLARADGPDLHSAVFSDGRGSGDDYDDDALFGCLRGAYACVRDISIHPSLTSTPSKPALLHDIFLFT